MRGTDAGQVGGGYDFTGLNGGGVGELRNIVTEVNAALEGNEPEIRAALVLMVDTVLLGQGEIPANLIEMMRNPQLEATIKDVVDSPEIRKHFEKLGESLDNIRRLADRIGERRFDR